MIGRSLSLRSDMASGILILSVCLMIVMNDE